MKDENSINKLETEITSTLYRLQELLDSIVKEETLYNKEHKIYKPAKHLSLLSDINNILGLETPQTYSNYKKQNIVKIEISIPDENILNEFCNLESTKTETFLLKNDANGYLRTIEKNECNGELYFIAKTKNNKEEQEREISAAEYLMLTMQINTQKQKISTKKYTFIYNKEKYYIYIVENKAYLEMVEGTKFPEFLEKI